MPHFSIDRSLQSFGCGRSIFVEYQNLTMDYVLIPHHPSSRPHSTCPSPRVSPTFRTFCISYLLFFFTRVKWIDCLSDPTSGIYLLTASPGRSPPTFRVCSPCTFQRGTLRYTPINDFRKIKTSLRRLLERFEKMYKARTETVLVLSRGVTLPVIVNHWRGRPTCSKTASKCHKCHAAGQGQN